MNLSALHVVQAHEVRALSVVKISVTSPVGFEATAQEKIKKIATPPALMIFHS